MKQSLLIMFSKQYIVICKKNDTLLHCVASDTTSYQFSDTLMFSQNDPQMSWGCYIHNVTMRLTQSSGWWCHPLVSTLPSHCSWRRSECRWLLPPANGWGRRSGVVEIWQNKVVTSTFTTMFKKIFLFLCIWSSWRSLNIMIQRHAEKKDFGWVVGDKHIRYIFYLTLNLFTTQFITTLRF